MEAKFERSDENQYGSWGYRTYEVPWNDHSYKFTISYIAHAHSYSTLEQKQNMALGNNQDQEINK